MKFSEKKQIVHDGEATYTVSEALGKKSATKEAASADKPEGGDRKAMFERMVKENEPKLLPEAKVGDTECYVIEATPKTPRNRTQVAKSVFSFAKDSGMLMKTVGRNAKDEEAESTTYSDVKLNDKIDPDRFKFKAPEGVTVRDRTAKP